MDKQRVRRYFQVRGDAIILRELPRREFRSDGDHKRYNETMAGQWVAFTDVPSTVTIVTPAGRESVTTYEIITAFSKD